MIESSTPKAREASYVMLMEIGIVAELDKPDKARLGQQALILWAIHDACLKEQREEERQAKNLPLFATLVSLQAILESCTLDGRAFKTEDTASLHETISQAIDAIRKGGEA